MRRGVEVGRRAGAGPRGIAALIAALIVGIALPAAATPQTITIKSGGALAPGAVVPGIKNVNGGAGAPACGVPLRSAAFTPADFAAAGAGGATYVVTPVATPLAALPSDPTAQWINWSASMAGNLGTPSSALYAQKFKIDQKNVCAATITLCWAVDDSLGDVAPYGTANPSGLYLNGVSAGPSFKLGTRLQETCATADVTSLVHSGVNTLQVYALDAGCAVSSVIYSARLTVENDCCKTCGGKTATSASDLYVSEQVCALDQNAAQQAAKAAVLATMTTKVDNICAALQCGTQQCLTLPVKPAQTCMLKKQVSEAPKVSCRHCVATGEPCKLGTGEATTWSCGVRASVAVACSCQCAVKKVPPAIAEPPRAPAFPRPSP